MPHDTWTGRDLPVLRTVVECYEESGTFLTRAADLERRTGFDHDTVQRALRALNSLPSFFEKVTEASGGEVIFVGPPTARARQVAGFWPSPETLFDSLVEALEGAATDETRQPEERSKLEKAALYLSSTAAQVAIAALGGAGGNLLSQ
jgi:hypothetical protein